MTNKRLVSLDIFRGLTVAFMILVNNGGGPTSFETLRHSKWNGITACDFVFPFFLFIMGISTFLSLRKTKFGKTGTGHWRKITKRAAILFMLGLFINWFELACKGQPFDLSHLRIWGVMQRISLCYLAVSAYAVTCFSRWYDEGNSRWKRPLLLTILGLLAVYTAIIVLGNGYAYDSATNILSRTDCRLFGYDHLYHKSPVDPEGLLSTISAIAHTMTGFLVAACFTTDVRKNVRNLLAGGLSIAIPAILLASVLPLNKRIWSPTYTLLTCGVACLLLAVIMYLVDVRKTKPWAWTLWFGTNPLFLYMLSEVTGIAMGKSGLSDMAYESIATFVSVPNVASLCYALLFTAAHAVVGWMLYKRKIFVKI